MDKQHKNAFRVLITVFLLFTLAFSGIVLYWFVSVYIPFNRYEKAVDDYTQTFPVEETIKAKLIDGKVYKVSKPKFMKFNGILTVYDEVDYESFSYENASFKQKNITLSIIIYSTGKHKYIIETGLDSNTDLSIEIDKDANLLEEFASDEKRKILIDYNDEVKEILKNAIELWELE